MAKRTRKGSSEGSGGREPKVVDVPFHTTARRKYLNYAISVITSRALPDVRDGLKPVQRRILYTMHNDLRLGPATKPLKCARIVGDVLGKYHPHGDSAVYDALVRMAQDFSLRYPLVDGHGNFGSLDGDSAAAYRYTEARLQALSVELLGELGQETVDFRPNYDGQTREPVVLPARVPQLLINGATGIAVGMATNIPPHNLAEVCAACEALIDDRSLTTNDLLQHIKGPDFPTGGHVLNPRAEIRKIYEEGHGALRLRAEYEVEEKERGARQIVITAIPYMVQKDTLVRSIGDLVFERKVPQLVDVRDESTKDVRIVCELKKDAEAAMVMAYLFKHTQLQTNFHVNLTCLVPSGASRLGEGPMDGAMSRGALAAPAATPAIGEGLEEGTAEGTPLSPARVDLKAMLGHFVDFRYEVVVRRFRHELRLLLDRIHILEGFRKIFGALDEAIRIIRNSDGKQDAAVQLMERFKLDERQTDSILELRLYRLARLEIKAILEELREKRERVTEIEAILKSPRRLWGVVRTELREARERYGDARRTRIGPRGAEELEYDEEAFIEDEDAFILLSRDGWIRRVGRIGDLSKVRLRPEDQVVHVLGGNTRAMAAFFTSQGSAYTIRINDIPQSRGYGDPIQRFFKFRDGEVVVGAVSFDSRVLGDIGKPEDPEGAVPASHVLAVSSAGYALRFALHPFSEPSTRSGRRFSRLREGETIVGVHLIDGTEGVLLATRKGRIIHFGAKEVSFLSGPGRGVLAIKLLEGDKVIGATVSRGPKDGLTVFTPGGKKIDVTSRRYRQTGRGGKGIEVVKRGGLSRVEGSELALPDLGEGPGGGSSNGASSGGTNGTGRRRSRPREADESEEPEARDGDEEAPDAS